MADIIWTPEAQRNVEVTQNYLLDVAPLSAAGILVGMIASVEPLTAFPRMGRVVPEFQREHLREVIFENYRIIYSIEPDAVYILTVLHASMDVASRLSELFGES